MNKKEYSLQTESFANCIPWIFRNFTKNKFNSDILFKYQIQITNLENYLLTRISNL